MGYLEEFCTFYEMTPELVQKCNEFRCSKDKEGDINGFFHDEYADYAKQQLGRSYCFVNEDLRKIVCAFTLCHSSINVIGLSNNRKKKIQKNIPHDKQRSQYPAVLLGQLAVFDGFNGKSIADEAISFIKSLLLPITKNPTYDATTFGFINTGCRFILVDAKKHNKVIDLYERNKFERVFTSDEDESASLKSYTKLSWRDKIYNAFHKDQRESPTKKTRQMYFDLIPITPKGAK